MTSIEEYVLSRRMPHAMEIPDMPTMSRDNFVHIGSGGTVFWSWQSEDASHKFIYGQTAIPDDPAGRAVFLISKSDSPEDFIEMLAGAMMPDEVVSGVIHGGHKGSPSMLMMASVVVELRRPGWN